jgi:hypothetical protein
MEAPNLPFVTSCYSVKSIISNEIL